MIRISLLILLFIVMVAFIVYLTVDSRFHYSPLKSQRVVRLLAACIRTAVRFRYARELSQADSIDLARAHDLRSALNAIAEKLDVHQNSSNDDHFRQAVIETILASQSSLGTEKIIATRRASVDIRESNQSVCSERVLVSATLRSVREETRAWEQAYSRFVSEIRNLHKSTKIQIEDLPLPLSTRLRAESELEKIIVDAIKRAGKV